MVIFPKQDDVFLICLKEKVEHISDDGDGADGQINDYIDQHQHDQFPAGAVAPHDDDQQESYAEPDDVAQERNQVDHRVEAETEPCAPDAELIVHQPSGSLDPRHVTAHALCGLLPDHADVVSC